MPTAVAIAEAIKSLLKGELSERMQAAQGCLQAGRSKPSDSQMFFLGLMLKLFATAVGIYRACEGLQPQIGSLPGQSLGDTEILNGIEGKHDGQHYFDSLNREQEGQKNKPLTLQQLLTAVVKIGEPYFNPFILGYALSGARTNNCQAH